MIGEELEAKDSVQSNTSSSAPYIMIIHEHPNAGSAATSATSSTSISILAIQLSTGKSQWSLLSSQHSLIARHKNVGLNYVGDIVFDEFADTVTRQQLETRLTHIEVPPLLNCFEKV
jgi:hypothetical protein